MSQNFECNKILDQLIEKRRSIRKFKTEAPPRELIEKVLQAGLWAPYASAAVTREDYRRFIVIPRESKATALIAQILKRQIQSNVKYLESKMLTDQFTKDHATSFLVRLRMMGELGIPAIGIAPYYIIVAEQRGIPPSELQSIAHCLQNIWLKASALGLGMQLISVTEQLADDKEFCDLINIPIGEYALDGCVIGYPDMSPPAPKRPRIDQITTWLS